MNKMIKSCIALNIPLKKEYQKYYDAKQKKITKFHKRLRNLE